MNDGRTAQEFEQLCLPHLDAAYNLAHWMLRKDADAQDVVQEAFVRALKAFDTFRGQEARAWLLAIVRNTAFTRLSRNKATMTQELDERLVEKSEQATDPQAALVRAADVQRVRDAVGSLPPELKEIVVLREMEQMSYKEISSSTGIPIGTVMSRLSRARERLRQILVSPAGET